MCDRLNVSEYNDSDSALVGEYKVLGIGADGDVGIGDNRITYAMSVVDPLDCNLASDDGSDNTGGTDKYGCPE
jgi:hypothetical protein